MSDNNKLKQCPLPQGPYLAAGRTQLMLGTRLIRTFNRTTGQIELQVRPGIQQGPTGEKIFIAGPSRLL